MTRDDHKQTNPISRAFHALVDGSLPNVIGFYMTWGNQVSPVFMFNTVADGRLHVFRFGKHSIAVCAEVGLKEDLRGNIVSVEVYREDGGQFTDSFRVNHIHGTTFVPVKLEKWGE